jgi:hypothetical protein
MICIEVRARTPRQLSAYQTYFDFLSFVLELSFPCFPARESPIAIACLALLTTPPLPPLPRFSTPFLEGASPSRRSLTHLLNTSSPLGYSYAVKSAPLPTLASVGPSSSASLPLSAHSSSGAIVENSYALEGDCGGSQDSFCVTHSSQAWRSFSQAISSCSIDCTILFMAASSIGFKGALAPLRSTVSYLRNGSRFVGGNLYRGDATNRRSRRRSSMVRISLERICPALFLPL